MKKVLFFTIMLLAVFVVAACGAREYEIAMVTDVGDIDDESFNQGTWEGIEAYALANGISHRYYQPQGESKEDYLDAIDLAVTRGAKIVVTPGFMFEEAIHEAQALYPDVMFILLDGVPHAGDWVPDIADNTVSIFYAEHESGFLAGYAAVKEGMTSLGFFGGVPVPPVVRFGVGFIAGAYYAADEMGVTLDFGPNNYEYRYSFAPDDTHRVRAAAWYDRDVQVIFSAAGGVGSNVMAAAQTADAWMIGVDVDQGGLNDHVLTSAMKALDVSVQQMLDLYYDGAFPGGESRTLTATEDGVALPMESSRFTNFTQADYDTIFGLLSDGTIEVPANHEELVAFFAEYELGDLPFAATDVLPAD